jgi:NADPH-dependent ferric siderophore reductase
MSSTKGKIIRFMSGLLERATVDAVEDVGGFRRVILRCKLPAFSGGTKVQILLPSDDVRTYTPVRAPGGLLLLGWKHAGGPGSHWLTHARVGEELPFFGPQRSLALAPGPVVLVGDETSVAAAASLELDRPGQVHAVIASDAAADVRDAAASIGLHHVEIASRGNAAEVASLVERRLATWADATVALTGGSELVLAVRSGLRQAGVRNIKTKTYWIPGKAGLD